jgi:hypothetical protein
MKSRRSTQAWSDDIRDADIGAFHRVFNSVRHALMKAKRARRQREQQVEEWRRLITITATKAGVTLCEISATMDRINEVAKSDVSFDDLRSNIWKIVQGYVRQRMSQRQIEDLASAFGGLEVGETDQHENDAEVLTDAIGIDDDTEMLDLVVKYRDDGHR